MRLIWSAILASVLLVGVYVAAGGASYKPSEVQDPCLEREWREPEGLEELGQQLVLSGIDGAACDLGVTREALARALATDENRAEFMEENSISDERFDAAVRAGLDRMVDDAERAGEIGGLVAAGLRALVRVVPAGEAFELLMDARPLIEKALGTGLDLSRSGSGDSDDDAGSGEGLGEQLRRGLEGLGGRLNDGLEDLRKRLEQEGTAPEGDSDDPVDEGLGRLKRGLDRLRESLDPPAD